MKVLKFATLFGGAVSAVNSLIVRNGARRDLDDTTTAVVLVTSMFTYTTLCSNARDCPASATVVLTSTTVVGTTTTICSTPGAGLPPYGASSSIASSALPIAPGSSTATTDSSVVTSFSTQPSGPRFSISIISGSTIDSPPTLSASGSLPVTSGTLPVHRSSYVLSSALPTPSAFTSSDLLSSAPHSAPVHSSTSSSATDAASTSFLFPTPPPSGYVPSASASSYAVPSNTTTDATHVSFSVSQSGPTSTGLPSPAGLSSSARGTYPTGSSTLAGSSSSVGVASSTGPSSSVDATYITGSGTPGPSSGATSYSSATGSTFSSTRVTLRSTNSGSSSPQTPPVQSESTFDSTVRVTSYLTQTLTSIITAPLVSSMPNSSGIEATYTSLLSSVSALPSGSGYPYLSGTANGTIVSPRPTYSEVPVNLGHVVGAGKSSLAAIVVALAFAHFA